MGLYIPGMEMPQDREIILRIDEKGEVYVYGTYPTELHKAVPVPPHGRLGDLDELYVHLNEWYLTHNPVFTKEEALYIRAMLAGIVEAPTIIPAEEGDT